jgi:hypothetical protein
LLDLRSLDAWLGTLKTETLQHLTFCESPTVKKSHYYKTLRICNLLKMGRLRSTLMSFLLSVTFTGLDKHTSLLRNPFITNPSGFNSTGPWS